MSDDDDKFKLNLTRRVGSAAAMHEPFVAAERAARLAGEPFADGLFRRVGKRWALRDGAAGITRSGYQDSKFSIGLPYEIRHQPRHKPRRKILKRQRWPMKQLQNRYSTGNRYQRNIKR